MFVALILPRRSSPVAEKEVKDLGLGNIGMQSTLAGDKPIGKHCNPELPFVA